MAKFTFTPRIRYLTTPLQGASLYGIRIPKGLSASDVPTPIYLTPEQMLKQQRTDPNSGKTGAGLGIVHGLTTAEFTVSFADMKTQWQNVSTGSSRPSWQFQGGDIFFDVTIGVYVLEGDRPSTTEKSRKIFGVIMEHELLHVWDDVDIVTNWMPTQSLQDDMVKKYLHDAKPVDDGMFRNWFQGEGFQSWIRDGFWASERNSRQKKRDAATEYAALTKKINDLRSQP
jgi:hypothetical protein